MSNQDQFTATGPAQGGSGQPGAAFSNNSNSANVFTWGVNVMAYGCGVLGYAGSTAEYRSPSEIPGSMRVGVAGISEDRGVYAIGGTTGVHAEIWHDPAKDPEYGTGIAVSGQCERTYETAIYGNHKSNGIAVDGESNGGPGGRFQSHEIAQLRLPPRLQGVPGTAEVGDVVVFNTGTVDHRKAEMWLCTEKNEKGRPVWREVVLGRTVVA